VPGSVVLQHPMQRRVCHVHGLVVKAGAGAARIRAVQRRNAQAHVLPFLLQHLATPAAAVDTLRRYAVVQRVYLWGKPTAVLHTAAGFGAFYCLLDDRVRIQ